MTYHENKSAHLCHVCGLLLGNRSQLSLHLKRNHQTPQPNQVPLITIHIIISQRFIKSYKYVQN